MQTEFDIARNANNETATDVGGRTTPASEHLPVSSLLPADLVRAIRATGRSQQRIERDARRIRERPPAVHAVRPCAIGDGINVLDDRWTALGRGAARHTVAFIPAAGAATRMFAPWEAAMPEGARAAEGYDELEHLHVSTSSDGAARLGASVLHWRAQPKVLIPLGGRRGTFLDEHRSEVAAMGLAGLHLAVQPAHRALVQRACQGPSPVKVATSVQARHTDTIAFDHEGRPSRDEGGAFVFRPSGHGALLQNLAKLRDCFVWVKSVDNVAREPNDPAVIRARIQMLGFAVYLQAKANEVLDLARPREAQAFMMWAFGLEVSFSRALSEVARPIRVCGMVATTGHEGGGPYWVDGPDGEARAQIVESAELSSEVHAKACTHFNPVDMVLSICPRSRRIPLEHHSDPERYMLVHKTHGGHTVHAVEEPGFWNGGMARWNTRFVELPEACFRPIKRVTDLCGLA